MSETKEFNYRRGERNFERHISVRSVDRNPHDLRKLSRVVIAMALREAEAEAQALAALKGSVDSDKNAPFTDEKSDDTETLDV